MNPDKGWDYNPGKDLLVGVNRAIDGRKGKASPVLLSALNSKIADDMKIITVPDFHLVQNALANVADKMSEWFPKGINGIYAVSNPELFAGFNQETGAFYISTSDELVKGFKPAHELISALQKIQSGELLTFNNEYAVETLWHEIMHGITGIYINRYPLNIEPFTEGVVQLAARNSYDKLLAALGGSQSHQAHIISGGLAYPAVTQNLLFLMGKAGIQGSEFADTIMNNKEWESSLKNMLAYRLSVSKEKVTYLLNASETFTLSAFKAKVDVQIRNARHNKGAF